MQDVLIGLCFIFGIPLVAVLMLKYIIWLIEKLVIREKL